MPVPRVIPVAMPPLPALAASPPRAQHPWAGSSSRAAPPAQQRGRGTGSAARQGVLSPSCSAFKQCLSVGVGSSRQGTAGPPAPAPALTPCAHSHRRLAGEGLRPDSQCQLAPEQHALHHVLPCYPQRGLDVEQLLIGLRCIRVIPLQLLVPPVPGDLQHPRGVHAPGRAAQRGGLTRHQGRRLSIELQRVREGCEGNHRGERKK